MKATNSDRFIAPVLFFAMEIKDLTVDLDKLSWAAISASEQPKAASRATSRSRGDKWMDTLFSSTALCSFVHPALSFL